MTLNRALNHERIVPICLALVSVLCWIYLFMGAGTMQEMGGMDMPMSAWPWTMAHAMVMLLMWLSMMLAMMLPSAAPVILLYSTISRRSASGVHDRSIYFALGYAAIWGCFSLVALLFQFFLEWAELQSPMMESTSNELSGILLIAAGIYQFTPLKRSCLRLCRSPLEFLMLHWRSGKYGAFAMGMRHGVYCIACCWALMLLLFVGGVMNLVWIIALAMFILVEKLFPGGEWIGKWAGVFLAVGGLIVLLPSSP